MARSANPGFDGSRFTDSNPLPPHCSVGFSPHCGSVAWALAHLPGQRLVRLPYKPEAPASEHIATHSLAGASGLYSQWFS
jgi:hypothetical protein